MAKRSSYKLAFKNLIFSTFGPKHYNQRYLLHFMLSVVNYQFKCWYTQEQMAKHLKMSERNICRVIKDLEKDGWLRVRKEKAYNDHLHNYYYITCPSGSYHDLLRIEDSILKSDKFSENERQNVNHNVTKCPTK